MRLPRLMSVEAPTGGHTEAESSRVDQKMEVNVLYVQKVEIKPGGMRRYETFSKIANVQV